MLQTINRISAFVVPVMLILILMTGLIRKTDVYNCFVEGASDGVRTVVRIFPAILAIYVAIAMLKASGLLALLENLLRPAMEAIGMPDGILPLALLRPVSGSGSIGLVSDILSQYGPDSLTGRIAAVMCAATETTFYTLALYFGAAKVKKTSCALPAALTADLVSITMSVFVCRILFA